MKNVKVSVILPSLNVVEYIREAVESVINQTISDIEIICVDAGSTDGTLEILHEYEKKDKRIKLIISDKRSYGYQMNLGIDISKGDYIGIVETDDYVPPYMYEELYEIAEANNLDLIKADFYRFTGEGNTISKAYYSLTLEESYYNRVINIGEELECFRFTMNTWSGIYKKSFLKAHNIRHNETPGASFQDNGFWFQTFMYAKRAYFCNKPYYMNRRDNPNSSVFSKSKIYCICDEYEYIYKILIKDMDIYKKFKFVYSTICYQNYKFNMERIADEYKLEFLKRYQSDFRRMRDKGELDRNLIGTRDWNILTYIMKDPLDYYEKEIKQRNAIYDRICKYDQVILYGVGMVGRKVLNDLTYRKNPANVICFAVSNKNDNVDEYHGMKIYEIKDLQKYAKKSVVVIATTEQYHQAIMSTLKKYNFENIIAIPEFGNDDISYANTGEARVSIALCEWYEKNTGRKLNLKKPITFNEKIQWLKIYDYSQEKARMLDKLDVRDIISDIIGKNYLLPLLGIYSSFNDIDFAALPQQYVIKATHGTGFNYFVRAENLYFDRAVVNRRCDEWLNTNYTYYNGLDMNYRNIKPRILIEPLVDGMIRHANYKVLCFYGEPMFIIVDTDKDKYGRRTRDVFDIEWRHQNLEIKYPKASITPVMPTRLSEMLNLTRIIAKDYILVRVDWFITKERLLFNQIKFSPGNGVEIFSSLEYEEKMGDLIKL